MSSIVHRDVPLVCRESVHWSPSIFTMVLGRERVVVPVEFLHLACQWRLVSSSLVLVELSSVAWGGNTNKPMEHERRSRATSAGNPPSPSPSPSPATFVLVHGAWHGGWCWRFVRRVLEKHGHTVRTPTLTGLGERSHLMSADLTMDTCCRDVANVLRYEDLTNVVLVGHSFGGSVISGVAELEPDRVRRLVYLDADVLEDGESPFASVTAEEADRRKELAKATSAGGVSFPPPDPRALGVHDEEQRAFLERHLTPHPISTYESALRLKGRPGEGFPCTYVVCTHPAYDSMNRARARASGYGWEMRDISTGHDLMISAPEKTAQLLMDVVATSESDQPSPK